MNLIIHTITATGLTVQCVLDTAAYSIGLRYTAKEIDALPFTCHEFHPDWNHTFAPTDTPEPSPH